MLFTLIPAMALAASLDRSPIDETIKRDMNKVRYCYQRELQKDATLEGKVTMKFTIGGDGAARSVEVKSFTLDNEQVHICLVSVFEKMVFPAPPGGEVVIVSYPLHFDVEEEVEPPDSENPDQSE